MDEECGCEWCTKRMCAFVTIMDLIDTYDLSDCVMHSILEADDECTCDDEPPEQE